MTLKVLVNTCEPIATDPNKFQLNQAKLTRVIGARLMARKVISHEIFTRESLDIRFSKEMSRGNMYVQATEICAVDDSS
jgi:hypothetical protein